MPVYNVATTVVDLVETDDGAQAQQILEHRLRHDGYELIEGEHQPFLSEDQTHARQALADEGGSR